MTGIERLREFVAGISPFTIACSVTTTSYDRKHMEVAGARLSDYLADIAEQIERELREERDRWDDDLCDAQMDKTCVTAVYLEMNRHVSGHEGMEDSPVARWARELREALGVDGRDHAADVSVSAYDLLPQEEREAGAWVREHGGLDAVKRRWECLSYYADPVPRSCMEKRLARLQRQIDESHAALRRRRETISELNRRACDLTRENAELRKRAMPEGYEWPRFESGEPVMLGDSVTEYVAGGEFEVRSIEFRDGAAYLREGFRTEGIVIVRPGERVKRPTPKVLDADGVEIYKGRIAYGTRGRKYRVTELCEYEPSIVHAQAIDDGELGDEFIAANTGLNSYQLDASKLTHERPIADTWERLEEDAEKSPCDYFGFDGEEICGKCPASGKNCEQTMARDLVRRAKALAERERGE